MYTHTDSLSYSITSKNDYSQRALEGEMSGRQRTADTDQKRGGLFGPTLLNSDPSDNILHYSLFIHYLCSVAVEQCGHH
jgi:hypothetical protein